MNSPKLAKLKNAGRDQVEIIELTPELAVELLDHNRCNRPITDSHVKRISAQILAGKWLFNGDTIKISDSSEILDGQHRLWAVVESKRSVKTAIVYGVPADAFATIDTIRRPRSGSDTASLLGATRHRRAIAGAATWLLRFQRGALESYRQPENRIENSDLSGAMKAHMSGILTAVEQVQNLKRLLNINIGAFLFYVIANRDAEIANKMLDILRDPGGVAMDHPFFQFRLYLTSDKHGKEDPLMTIALGFKAANAVSRGDKLKGLTWKPSGRVPEPFPILRI